MTDELIQWATLLSPIISVIAVIVALRVANNSSKDAQEQINAIRHLLDVFVAANNLDIVEAQRKYQQQLVELDNKIEETQMEVDTIYPFVGGARIDHIIAEQEKAQQKAHLNQLLMKRKEIEVNLSLIQDYIHKAMQLMELKKYKKRRITPQGWKEVTLADAFNTSSGATPLSTEASYYENGTIPWINSGELASPYIYDTTNFISQAGFENSSTEIYPIDTVLVAMYGATAGKASLLKMEACTNQAICAILPNKDYSSTFLKYSIDTLYDHLVGLSSGSARDNLSQAALKKLKLIMPPTKDEQNKLVSILALIDRKIELNRAINQNLEAMAKQLYDYWFVQFDFPNENGKPYKSCGGKMVWNEKLKREIPSCFNIANMEKLCKFRNGINYSKDETGNDFQIVNVRNISSSKILLDGEDFDTITVPMTKAENYLLKSEDIIIARSGCPGSTRLLISPTNTLFCGFIICCTPHNSSMRNYLTYCLKQLEGTNATTSGGSILQNVSQDTLKGLPIVVPNKQIINKFNETIELIFTRILNCLKETKALTKQRDELLPLLMNGQVSVNSDLSAH